LGSAASRRLAALATAVAVALLVALPRIAEACPYCAANDDSGSGRSQTIVLAAFILLPFAIAGVAVVAIVRGVRRARAAEARPLQRFPGDL